MTLSVVIPAHNEAGCLEETIRSLHAALSSENILHEIVVVDDHSSDGTPALLRKLGAEIPALRTVTNEGPGGFGMAVRLGLERFSGDAVCLCMADGSDAPEDVVLYYRTLMEQKVDCVFGSRFIRGSMVEGYPWPKLLLNRLANYFIRVLFHLTYNDVTNAFKLYRRTVIAGAQPFLSVHFNLTVELPLKAIVRGYTYAVVPISWRERKHGISKLAIKEMGSRYLFVVLYCFLEKWLVRRDYQRIEIT